MFPNELSVYRFEIKYFPYASHTVGQSGTFGSMVSWKPWPKYLISGLHIFSLLWAHCRLVHSINLFYINIGCDDVWWHLPLGKSRTIQWFQSIGVQVQLRQAINFRLWATLCLCAHWRAQLLACVVEHAPWELGRLVAQRVPSWCLMVLITEFHASSHFVSDRVCPLVSHTNSLTQKRQTKKS